MNRYRPIYPLKSLPVVSAGVDSMFDIEGLFSPNLHGECISPKVERVLDTQGHIWRHFLTFAKALGVKHYIGLFDNPPTASQLKQSLGSLITENERTLADTLIRRWPLLSPGWHWIDLSGHGLQVHLWFGDVFSGLQQISQAADAVIADPNQTLNPQFVHAVSRRLIEDGFLLVPDNREEQPQPPHMAYAGFSPVELGKPAVWRGGKVTRTLVQTEVKRVAVIGAGMAGALCADQLLSAGLDVVLYDRNPRPAMGASGNWAGAFHPHFTKDDTYLSQLTRLGCEYTLQHLQLLTSEGLLKQGVDWDIPGHLLTLEKEDEGSAIDTLNRLKMPCDLVRWHAPTEELPHSGYWIGNGGWVKPVKWIDACLRSSRYEAKSRGELAWKFGEPISLLPSGFDATIVACAEHSLTLATAAGFRANQVKGQITLVHKHQPLPAVLSGQTYAIDTNEDWWLLGATYERPVTDMSVSDVANKQNIERFGEAFPKFEHGEAFDARCAIRSVWPDRLPAVGPVPGLDNVYLCTGFASRGLTWAAMASRQIRRMLEQDSWYPTLLDKLLPSRYHKPADTDQ